MLLDYFMWVTRVGEIARHQKRAIYGHKKSKEMEEKIKETFRLHLSDSDLPLFFLAFSTYLLINFIAKFETLLQKGPGKKGSNVNVRSGNRN